MKNVSFGLDVKILFQTVAKVFKHEDIIEAGKQELFWDFRERQWAEGTVPRPESSTEK